MGSALLGCGGALAPRVGLHLAKLWWHAWNKPGGSPKGLAPHYEMGKEALQ